MTLIDLMIDQYERSSKWNNITLGNASFRIEEKHYKQLGKDEVVSQAKQLEKEGLLRIRWVKGYYNGFYRYGTVLNTQTLKNASIVENQNIKKILTIENKANFEAEPYEEGTLIIFSHGYFTPLERIFLTGLNKKLNDKLKDKPIEYYHSGDLDYGGVCIFRYIKNRIFPDLKPYRMDKETWLTS